MVLPNLLSLFLVAPIYITTYLQFSPNSIIFSYFSYVFIIIITIFYLPNYIKNKLDNFYLGYLFLLIFLYSASSGANFDFHKANITFAFVPILYFFMFIPFLALIQSSPEKNMITFLKNLNIFLMPYIIFVIYEVFNSAMVIGERFLSDFSHPNQIAEVIFVIVVTSVFHRSSYIKTLVVLSGLFCLFFLQARTIILSSSIFLFFYYFPVFKKYWFLVLLSLIFLNILNIKDFF